ncbi:hypothetical protein Tco_0623293, partial [Tanacetum coccineum]
KFATYTLLGSALTWRNFYVKTVGHDAAYGMPWKILKKMMTAKYCPRNEINKLEIEIWNMKVKGTDVESFTQLKSWHRCVGECFLRNLMRLRSMSVNFST